MHTRSTPRPGTTPRPGSTPPPASPAPSPLGDDPAAWHGATATRAELDQLREDLARQDAARQAQLDSMMEMLSAVANRLHSAERPDGAAPPTTAADDAAAAVEAGRLAALVDNAPPGDHPTPPEEEHKETEQIDNPGLLEFQTHIRNMTAAPGAASEHQHRDVKQVDANLRKLLSATAINAFRKSVRELRGPHAQQLLTGLIEALLRDLDVPVKLRTLMSIPPHEFIANNAPDMSADDASVSTVSGRWIAHPPDKDAAVAALHDAQSIQYLVQREINELAKQQAGGDMKDGTKIDAQDVMFKKVQLATRAARYNAAFELVAVLFMTAIEVNADIFDSPHQAVLLASQIEDARPDATSFKVLNESNVPDTSRPSAIEVYYQIQLPFVELARQAFSMLGNMGVKPFTVALHALIGARATKGESVASQLQRFTELYHAADNLANHTVDKSFLTHHGGQFFIDHFLREYSGPDKVNVYALRQALGEQCTLEGEYEPPPFSKVSTFVRLYLQERPDGLGPDEAAWRERGHKDAYAQMQTLPRTAVRKPETKKQDKKEQRQAAVATKDKTDGDKDQSIYKHITADPVAVDARHKFYHDKNDHGASAWAALQSLRKSHPEILSTFRYGGKGNTGAAFFQRSMLTGAAYNALTMDQRGAIAALQDMSRGHDYDTALAAKRKAQADRKERKKRANQAKRLRAKNGTDEPTPSEASEPDGSGGGPARANVARATFRQYLDMAIRDVEDTDAATDPTPSLDPQVRISPDRDSIRSLLVASSVPAAPAGDSDAESVGSMEGDLLKRSARTVNATSVVRTGESRVVHLTARLHRQ